MIMRGINIQILLKLFDFYPSVVEGGNRSLHTDMSTFSDCCFFNETPFYYSEQSV